MNTILEPITRDGRTGFDKYGQLVNWSLPDEHGYKNGIIICDVRGHTCYVCGQSWKLDSESLRDQITDNYKRLMHRTCYDGVAKVNAHSAIVEALMKAGYLFSTEEVPPRYPHSTPWQRITVFSNNKNRDDTGYRIVLGRRKRVWEIRFHALNSLEAFGVHDISPLFEDVTDTKGVSYDVSEHEPEFGKYFYVHAWDEGQLVDYLTRMRLAIPAETDRNTWK